MAYKAFFDEIRTFGVEIECYGVPRYTIMASFRVHGIRAVEISETDDVLEIWRLSNDGSIQGEHSVEVVSPPLCGTEGLRELSNVLNVLYVLGCKVNMSCGFHVHWNCGDFTGKNVLSLLRLYAKFEPVIDYLVSPSRRANRNEHCQTMIKDNNLYWVRQLDPSERDRASEVALAFEKQFSTYSYQGRTHRGGRYHKVNIAAYNMYGTIEFRHHQGTLSADKAVNWVIFTQQLVNKAKYVSVSKEPSADVTLGGLMRTLKISYSQSEDVFIQGLADWMKKRYAEFKKQEDQDVTEEVPVAEAFLPF
jgi:hypothetical protein